MSSRLCGASPKGFDMLKNTLRVAVVGAALAGSFGLAQAQTINFSTSNFAMTGIGADAAGSDFDKLTFTGLSSLGFDVSAPVVADIGSLAFEIGPNCDIGTCAIGAKISPAVNFTVNGVTQQFTLPFFWDVSDVADTVTFSKPAPLLFTLAGGAKLSIDFLTPGALAGTAFDTVYSEKVQAKFSVTPAVPEPSTYAMLLGGLAVVGAVARRKSRAAA